MSTAPDCDQFPCCSLALGHDGPHFGPDLKVGSASGLPTPAGPPPTDLVRKLQKLLENWDRRAAMLRQDINRSSDPVNLRAHAIRLRTCARELRALLPDPPE